MLYPIEGLPDNVVGIAAEGKVTGDDYAAVIVPAIEDALTRHDKLRLLYHCPDGTSFDASAAWEDTKVGFKHFTHFERVAVVTDEAWLQNAVKLFGFVMPGEVQVFPAAALDEVHAERAPVAGVLDRARDVARERRLLLARDDEQEGQHQ